MGKINENINDSFATVLKQVDNSDSDASRDKAGEEKKLEKKVSFDESLEVSDDGGLGDDCFNQSNIDDEPFPSISSPIPILKIPSFNSSSRHRRCKSETNSGNESDDGDSGDSFGVLDEEEVQDEDDPSIVSTVKYKTFVVDWQEGKGFNPRVLIVIHLPSGTPRKQIGVKVQRDGCSLTYFEKYNSIFANANFVLDAYKNSKPTDAMNVAVGKALQAENQIIQDGICDFIQAKMDITLPFPCEERPIHYVFGDAISDIDLYRFKAKDPHLVSKRQWYLLCYIELEGRDKNRTRVSGVVDA